MARSATAKNTFDKQVVQSLVGKIEGYFDDLESERGSYMAKCRGIRESVSAVYDEAEARGVPKKELRTLIKSREKLKGARKLIEELEQDQRETVELLAEAFGDAADLPLFASKINKAQSAGAAASVESTAHH